MSDTTVPSRDQMGRAILTVGQLRHILRDVPEHVHVVMDDGQGWYVNVGATIVPGADYERAEFLCVTFDRGDEYDSRQT